MFTGPLRALIDELGRLPGIGPKSAQRIAFHILKVPNEDAHRLSDASSRSRSGRRCATGASTWQKVGHCAPSAVILNAMTSCFAWWKILGTSWPWSVRVSFMVDTTCWAEL